MTNRPRAAPMARPPNRVMRAKRKGACTPKHTFLRQPFGGEAINHVLIPPSKKNKDHSTCAPVLCQGPVAGAAHGVLLLLLLPLDAACSSIACARLVTCQCCSPLLLL
jgi:hypothetical protein